MVDGSRWLRIIALVAFVVLAIAGRINDWEVAVIPLVVVGMLIWSSVKGNTHRTAV